MNAEHLKYAIKVRIISKKKKQTKKDGWNKNKEYKEDQSHK